MLCYHSGLEYSDDIAKNRANFGNFFVAKIELWTTFTFLITSLFLKSFISDCLIFILLSR